MGDGVIIEATVDGQRYVYISDGYTRVRHLKTKIIGLLLEVSSRHNGRLAHVLWGVSDSKKQSSYLPLSEVELLSQGEGAGGMNEGSEEPEGESEQLH